VEVANAFKFEIFIESEGSRLTEAILFMEGIESWSRKVSLEEEPSNVPRKGIRF
jgi:hypothetical protein